MAWQTIPSPAALPSIPVAFALGDAELDLSLTVGLSASVGDIVAALAGGPVGPDTALWLDGRPVDLDEPAASAGLRAGSRLELGPRPDALGPRTAAPVVEVRVTGGTPGGSIRRLAPGRWVVGRASEDDICIDSPTVSSVHLELDVDPLGSVTVTDLGSHNGTLHQGTFVTGATSVLRGSVLHLGSVEITIEPVDDRPDRPAGAITFNRPPRRAAHPGPAPLVAPEEPTPPTSRSRLAVAALAAPMVMGGVMAAMWGPRMALFAVFTPVLMLGSWIEDRRRAGKDGRRTAAEARAELERFDQALVRAAGEQRAWLREARPDVAEVAARAADASTRLWERRLAHDDVLRLRLGTGTVPWKPPVTERSRPAAAALALLAQRSIVGDAPLEIDLSAGHVLGLVGSRGPLEAVLRSLVAQAVTHHGPADLRVAILTDADRAGGWAWAKWLPHTAAGGEAAGLRLLAGDEQDLATVIGALVAMASPPVRSSDAAASPVPHRLLVVDGDGLTEGRPSLVRALLTGAHGATSGIVVAADPARLPSCCTTVAVIDDDGVMTVSEPATRGRVDGLLSSGMTEAAAAAAARSLAGIDDPEVAEVGAGLPDRVGLLPLLGIEATGDDIVRRWATTEGLRAPIGVTAQGPLVVDLVADGPHGLLGGTTGAGKSELLRTLVVSLAASASPDELTFVLIDYKGGSAFDACARLPHTVGMVTDLDDQLGQRALRCLDAELRHRESVLRAAGATDLDHYRSLGSLAPLPRLVVVIDEFATLAAELPDFIDALVGVAQRGRSLGVHLLLATQRPAGAVKDNIRANTNLRVALRMQDNADSTDVIDTPVAAAIGRRQAGRGYARLGPGEVVPFQTAIVSTPWSAEVGPSASVTVRPLVFGPEQPAATTDNGAVGPSDLGRLVDAINEANDGLGLAAPRRPWTEPLPALVTLDEIDPTPLRSVSGAVPRVVIGLADDPAGQRQVPLAWDSAGGGLLLYGLAGSGTTTALDTLARSLARIHRPEDLHVYVFDFGAGALDGLTELPHVGAVVRAGQPERQRRLLRHLRGELDRRRGEGRTEGQPGMVVLIDNWSGMAAAFEEDAADLVLRDEVARLVADGPAVGIWTAITADQVGAVPLTIANLMPSKLVFRLSDPNDYRSIGLDGRVVPAGVAGRAVDARTGWETQIAVANGADHLEGRRTATGIGVLPADVGLDAVAGWQSDAGLSIGLGLADSTLAAGGLVFRPGEHATISGPARSGRSTALVTIAAVATSAGLPVLAVAPRPSSPLRSLAGCVESIEDVEDRLIGRGPLLVLVDDAEALDDPTGMLCQLLSGPRGDVHVVAAGRADALRSAYGHWTRDLRRSRLGLALRPETEDGDLFGATFPRRPQPPGRPGCGFLIVDGTPELFQVAAS